MTVLQVHNITSPYQPFEIRIIYLKIIKVYMLSDKTKSLRLALCPFFHNYKQAYKKFSTQTELFYEHQNMMCLRNSIIN